MFMLGAYVKMYPQRICYGGVFDYNCGIIFSEKHVEGTH